MDVDLKSVLPSISDEETQNVMARLDELGVKTKNDLEFLEEKDLVGCLKVIDIRKLLKCFKQRETNELTHDQFAASCSNFSHFTESQVATKNDWVSTFEVPWEQFPSDVLKACEEKKLVTKKSMSQVIRLTVGQIMKLDKNPGRKVLKIIAQKFVDRYPVTFQDRFGDTVIADGSVTIMKKLEHCVENLVRTTPKKSINEGNRKRKTLSDSYGCVNWQPNNFPPGESESSQEQHRLLMIEENQKQEKNEDIIMDLMRLTYYSQRCDINKGETIESLFQKWPCLFEPAPFFIHANELFGKNIGTAIEKNVESKVSKIYNFMESLSNPDVAASVAEIAQAKCLQRGKAPEVAGALCLLLTYFGEERKHLFIENKDPISKDDVPNLERIVDTPFIATLGFHKSTQQI